VLDRRSGRPAGVGRVVRGGGRTLDDGPDLIGRDLSAVVEAHGLHDGGTIWDLATLSVLPDYRNDRSGVTVSALLYRSLLRAGQRADVRHLVSLLDRDAHRDLTLLGVPFVPMAGAEPVDGVHAVYAPFAAVEPAIAEQARRLRRVTGPYAGDLPARGLRRIPARRLAARLADHVATGRDLDEHILLPGLERRRYRGLRTRG
jgi:N-acyl-L-homoserine lactone synthetase